MHSSKSASNDRVDRFQQLVLAHYIPEAVLHKIESTAQYDPVREEWLVIRLNFAGNVLRARYPERYASTKEGAKEGSIGESESSRSEVRADCWRDYWRDCWRDCWMR